MSSRVTHPSATICAFQRTFQRKPSDLHVLSTPPAFVLSQDQTLHGLRFLLDIFTRCILLARFGRPRGGEREYTTLLGPMQPPGEEKNSCML